ncbi:MAG: hypothetical protein D6784_10580 [Chloroflexi bacterium]|nr:MAG: hypothetical protein D6784_10580 [Chloroflexota bacterium]
MGRVFQNLAGLLAGRFDRGGLGWAAPSVPRRPVVASTGLRGLDTALGIGGLPAGGVTELVGSPREQSAGGVVCLSARIAAHFQHRQQMVAIIDLTGSYDAALAEQCGLAAAHHLLSRPRTLRAALKRLEQAARQVDLVIVCLGMLSETLAQVPPALRRTLLARLRRIVRSSSAAFLLLTTPQEKHPFHPLNYPRGFPLDRLAEIRLWIQEEHWLPRRGPKTTCRLQVAVVDSRLAAPGKGVSLRIKLSP